MSKRTFYQLVAMTTMTIDHVGVLFFDNNPIFRLIGRFALPIYIYLFVLNLKEKKYNSDQLKERNINTLILFLITTPFYYYLFKDKINILLLFAIVLSIEGYVRSKKEDNNSAVFFKVLAITELLFYFYFSPNLYITGYNLLQVSVVYLFFDNLNVMLIAYAGISYLLYVFVGPNLNMFSFLAIAFLNMLEPIKENNKKPSKLYLRFYRMYYTLHLIVLTLIKIIKTPY